MGICYLYGAGTYYSDSTPEFSDKDYIIAVDGGYDFLKGRNITPNLIVGDMDSMNPETSKDIINNTHIPVISFPVKKDYTDMYLAAEEAVKLGYSSLVIYGGCGGRIDHTISNISLLAHLAALNTNAFLFANGYIITAVKDTCFSLSASPDNNTYSFIKAKENGYISVFSHSDISTGVSISGLKYETDNITLTNTMVLGTSNEFCGRDVNISVKNGTLLIIMEL